MAAADRAWQHGRRGARCTDFGKQCVKPMCLLGYDNRSGSKHSGGIVNLTNPGRCATAGKGSKRFDRPNRSEQRFNDDGDYPVMLHIERVGSTRREVEDATASIWATVIDFEDNGAAVIEIGNLRERGEREPAMRSGGCYCVEELTAGGSVYIKPAACIARRMRDAKACRVDQVG